MISQPRVVGKMPSTLKAPKIKSVQELLIERRKRFEETNNTEEMENKIEKLKCELEKYKRDCDIRMRNGIMREIERITNDIKRAKKKKNLFDVLSSDVNDALQYSRAHRNRRILERVNAHENISMNEVVQEINNEDIEDVQMLFEDVMLIHDGERLQDARTRVDDVCVNCGSSMERNLSLSFLICPNLDCGHMRWYIDTSTYSSTTCMGRVDQKTTPKQNINHYPTFLNTAQGKTSKKFPKEFLMKICYYCYVEGARKPSDITKKMINKAQKYIGTTEYNITIILKTLLKGEHIRLPAEVVKKMQLLFRALFPVFETMKSDLNPNRSNMVNFGFVSRVLCRLLGYDVFLPLFDPLDMKINEIRHSAFMRRMFHHLGWIWEDGRLTDVPDRYLDEYEECEREGTIYHLPEEYQDDKK